MATFEPILGTPLLHIHSASDLSSVLNSIYVQKSGDTMTGLLTINTSASTIDTNQNVLKLQYGGVDTFVGRKLTKSVGPSDGYTDWRIIGSTNSPAITSLLAPNGTDYADWTYDGNNMEIEVSTGDLNIRTGLIGGTMGNVNIWSLLGNPILKVGNQNLTEALELQYNGTDGFISVTTGNILIGHQTHTIQVKVSNAGFTKALIFSHDNTNGLIDVTSGNLVVGNQSNQVKLRVNNAGFTQSTDVWNDGSNGHISSSVGSLDLDNNTNISGNIALTATGSTISTTTTNQGLTINPNGTGNVNIYSTTQNIKLRVGNSNFGQTIDMYHDGANGNINVTTGNLNIGESIAVTGNVSPSGNLVFTGGTPTVTTASNADLTINPNGTGNLVLYSTTNNMKLRIGDTNFSHTLDLQHDGSNAQISTTLGNINFGSPITLSTPLAVAQGGTGQTSYTDGQLLIGNSSGNTLTKANLTGTSNQITVTNGNGSITLATPQNIHTAASPTFAGATLNGLVTIIDTGNLTENISTAGIFIGRLAAGSHRIVISNGTGAQNWEIDNTSGTLRFFIPSVLKAQLTNGGAFSNSGYMRVGSTTAPTNTTAGDLTATRTFIGTNQSDFTVSNAGKITGYSNISTVSNGVPSELATIDSTGLTANVGASTLYAVPASGAGLYRVSAYLVTTTAASVSSTMPNAQVVYTDSDSNTSVTLDVSPILGAAGLGQSGTLAANTVGTVFSGSVVIYVKASTTIQYQTVNYASTAAGMAYALRMKLEAL